MREVRTILNQHERSGAYMIPTEIHSYMRSNIFALLFILSCTCGGSFPKPNTTQGYVPNPLQRAAHVVLSDNTTSKQCSENTEIHTGAQVLQVLLMAWVYDAFFWINPLQDVFISVCEISQANQS